MGIIALIYGVAVWRIHDYYDGYRQTAALHAEITDHTKIEQKNNAVAAQYEADRSGRDQKIQDVQQKLESAHALSVTHCPVPGDIMQGIRAANSHDLSR